MFRILIFLFLGLSSSGVWAADPEPMRIQIPADPVALEPFRVIDQVGLGILRNVMTGLFRLDESGKIQNGLVANYSISKDRLTYRFRLKKDARWSDGKPVTVDDFVFGFRHAIDPTTACPDADKFFAIKNARAIFSERVSADKLGVSKSSDELVVQLESPDASLLLEFSLPAASPLRQDVWQSHHHKWSIDFPVTGDYRIADYKPAYEIRLEPNPVTRSPGQRSIVYQIISEETAAMNLFESGRIDILSSIVPADIPRFQKKGLVRSEPSTLVFYFSFNVAKPPFDDLDWRRAVASSVDREGMARILNGTAEVTSSFLPAAIDGSTAYQPKKFAAAVEKVKKSPQKKQITLIYPQGVYYELAAEKFQHDMAERLGLRIRLEPMDAKMVIARLATDPPEMYFLSKGGLYNDPLNHLNGFNNSPEPNFSHYLNPAYEKMVEDVKRTPPGPARTKLAQKSNRLIVEDDVIVVPVLLKRQIFGVGASVRNFHVNPYQVISLRELTK